MYRTEDVYEFSFSNEVTQEGITKLNGIWKQYGLDKNYFRFVAEGFEEGETDLSFILNSKNIY